MEKVVDESAQESARAELHGTLRQIEQRVGRHGYHAAVAPNGLEVGTA
jgi:hypothetical protein